ncbi:MAG TPA: GatB/YqeY domain-containing protein [Candidatus Saccharimonadales bacterium]|nr:GatB/YqeY domain-containing protein [Candidatus Saccharimonadales bacterium]
MSLQTQLDEQLIAAMKAGETEKRDVLRMLKSAIKNAAIEESKAELPDDEVLAVIRKEAKKRKESILAFEQANKPYLVAAEKAELAILETYLPAQMDEAGIRTKVKEYLAAHPSTVAQTGQVMGGLSGELSGQADMGLVAKIVREELNS